MAYSSTLSTRMWNCSAVSCSTVLVDQFLGIGCDGNSRIEIRNAPLIWFLRPHQILSGSYGFVPWRTVGYRVVLALLLFLGARASGTRASSGHLCRRRIGYGQRSGKICFICEIEAQRSNRDPVVLDCPAVSPFRGTFQWSHRKPEDRAPNRVFIRNNFTIVVTYRLPRPTNAFGFL